MSVPARGLPDAIEADISVAPMIDILLVLLVIFILAQAFGRDVVPTTLPAPVAAPVVERSAQLVLDLRPDGFALNGEPVPEAGLDAELRGLYADRPVKVLFVRPSPSVSVQQLVSALDRVRADGVLVTALLPPER